MPPDEIKLAIVAHIRQSLEDLARTEMGGPLDGVRYIEVQPLTTLTMMVRVKLDNDLPARMYEVAVKGS